MWYEHTVPFGGDVARALQRGAASLTAVGFRAVAQDGAPSEFVGPGMLNTRRNALLGASRIRILACPAGLAIQAELGGADRMARFLVLLFVGLSAFLFLLASAVLMVAVGPGPWAKTVGLATGGHALFWLALGPLWLQGMRANTCRALDRLLQAMARTGEAG